MNYYTLVMVPMSRGNLLEIDGGVNAKTIAQCTAAGAQMLSGPRARATIGFPAVRAA